MKQQVLQSIGFQAITRHNAPAKEVKQENIVISAREAAGSQQIAVSLTREILDKMKWEISQRVNVLVNPENNTIALIRAKATDKSAYVISCQGSTQEQAIASKRGGVIRFAWREKIGQRPAFCGQQTASVSRDRSTLVIAMP